LYAAVALISVTLASSIPVVALYEVENLVTSLPLYFTVEPAVISFARYEFVTFAFAISVPISSALIVYVLPSIEIVSPAVSFHVPASVGVAPAV